MFSTGMRESSGGQGEVPVVVNIKNIPYDVFKQIMYYLYTGEFILDQDRQIAPLDKVIEILGVADAEFIEDVSKAGT